MSYPSTGTQPSAVSQPLPGACQPGHTAGFLVQRHDNMDSGENPHDVAVEQLERLGLSSYAAQTFVGLASLGTGTARDVSQVTEVPRTRVYDAIDELQSRGLVDVQQSSPKKFWSISADTASRTFRRELQRRTETLQGALAELEPTEHQSEQRGVWTVDGQQPVTQRAIEFFETADEEIVYMTVDALLTEDIVAGLREAADRGVSIELAGMSTAVREQVLEQVPGATAFESPWAWSDASTGRLMLVDGRTTLVSALVTRGRASDQREETAIWGEGKSNSLVAVLRTVFSWRLDDE